MGMPVIVKILGNPPKELFQKVFDYFKYVDEKFSPYKKDSEVTKINNKKLKLQDVKGEMKLILKLSRQTKKQTDGYFNVFHKNHFDPSGLVKGWAIKNAARIIQKAGFKNFYVSAGGDIQTGGLNKDGKKWAVGIRNPFKLTENIKIVYLTEKGVATSGTYERGNHIYNPKEENSNHINEIISLTVIGPNIYEADRFATAAFAMGKKGINFIERLESLEGYMIDTNGIATLTTGFEKYAQKD